MYCTLTWIFPQLSRQAEWPWHLLIQWAASKEGFHLYCKQLHAIRFKIPKTNISHWFWSLPMSVLRLWGLRCLDPDLRAEFKSRTSHHMPRLSCSIMLSWIILLNCTRMSSDCTHLQHPKSSGCCCKCWYVRCSGKFRVSSVVESMQELLINWY